MFIDKVKILVKSGDGGDGIVSFRREKYIPRGGPDGGDGGRGGSVYIIASKDVSSLIEFRYQKKFIAGRGGDGKGKRQTGKKGNDIYIKVPCGSEVIDAETGVLLADLTDSGQKVMIAEGGQGGRGNFHFASSVRQAPRICTPGQPGQEKKIIISWKLISDVCLVGFPNVGKSTIISQVSNAIPKIADYPFTTLVPNLGQVKDENTGRSFVISDIPGLIAGAHRGAGLGTRFLKHVERARLILHVVDMDPGNGRDAAADYRTINRELRLYDKKLSKLKQFIVANKMDCPGSEEKFEQFREKYRNRIADDNIFKVCALNRQDLVPLVEKVMEFIFSD